MKKLPTFIELAKHRIKLAGKRDKTVNIKLTIGLARTMVEAETKKRLAPTTANLATLTRAAESLTLAASHVQDCEDAGDSTAQSREWHDALNRLAEATDSVTRALGEFYLGATPAPTDSDREPIGAIMPDNSFVTPWDERLRAAGGSAVYTIDAAIRSKSAEGR